MLVSLIDNAKNILLEETPFEIVDSYTYLYQQIACNPTKKIPFKLRTEQQEHKQISKVGRRKI